MEKYKTEIRTLQKSVFSILNKEAGLPENILLKVSQTLMDEACIYRFYKKSKYSLEGAQDIIIEHIKWMLGEHVFENTFNSFKINTHAYEYLVKGFLYFCGHDKLGRPIGIMNLSHYDGNSDIDSLKKYMIFMLEIAQRMIKNMNEEERMNNELEEDDTSEWNLHTQICIIIDLNNLRMSSLNYEIFPTLIKIFINHYPYIAETVYILNYRWIHAGIWGMVKQMLSEAITKNLLFLKKDEIFEYISPDELLIEFGGNNTYQYNCHSCQIYKKFGEIKPYDTIPTILLEKDTNSEKSENEELDEDSDEWFDTFSNENENKQFLLHPSIEDDLKLDMNSINSSASSLHLLEFNETDKLSNQLFNQNTKEKRHSFLFDNAQIEKSLPIPASINPNLELNIDIKNYSDKQLSNNHSNISLKIIIYNIIKLVLLPIHSYLRRVRCTSVYFELVIYNWLKKVSTPDSLFTTTKSNSKGKSYSSLTHINSNTLSNLSNNYQNFGNISTVASTCSTSSSATLTSPSLQYLDHNINHCNSSCQMNDDDRHTMNHHTSSPSPSLPLHHLHSHSSTDSKENSLQISSEELFALVQQTLKACLPDFYNPFKDSLYILSIFTLSVMISHLIYPYQRYRLYSTIWRNLYTLRRNILVMLGIRPKLSNSVIQVI